MTREWKERAAEIAGFGGSRSNDQQPDPKISVMLPTFRRLEALTRTLAALEDQSLAKADYEVVAVDDGSRDGTGSFLDEFTSRTDLRFTYLVLYENGGPARARNFGLSRCRGQVVLIIGDDIAPTPDLVATHLRSHERNPEITHAVLGQVSFPDDLQPDAFMRWLEMGGRKYFFNYQDLVPGEEAGPLFFYTCNVSVKKALLERSGWFDESFPYASHEDLELGYRLAEQGMRLVYEPRAAGYHYHALTIRGIARRIYLMGYSAELFWRKVGDRGGLVRRFIRFLITSCVSSPPGRMLWQRLRKRPFPRGKACPFQWHALLFLSFFIGLSDCKRGNSTFRLVNESEK